MKRSRLRNGLVGGASAIGLLAIGFVGNWEGLRLYAYQDVIGVWTACYGETHGIRPGMKFTRDQCDVMFLDSLEKHERGMRACMVKPDSIPPKTYVAFVSFTYNVGIGAYCRSTLARLVNVGNLRGACDQLMNWTRAGGRVVKGLVNRRTAERKLCLEGLA